MLARGEVLKEKEETYGIDCPNSRAVSFTFSFSSHTFETLFFFLFSALTQSLNKPNYLYLIHSCFICLSFTLFHFSIYPNKCNSLSWSRSINFQAPLLPFMQCLNCLCAFFYFFVLISYFSTFVFFLSLLVFPSHILTTFAHS